MDRNRLKVYGHVAIMWDENLVKMVHGVKVIGERKVTRLKKRKRIGSLKVKHTTPSRIIDALIGNEEQNGK